MSKPARPKRPTLNDTALEYFRDQGRNGGKIGGKKRMAKLTAEERRALGRKAARARWGKARAGDPSRPLPTRGTHGTRA